MRTFGVVRAGMTCRPDSELTDSLFNVTLPNDTASGDMYIICVRFTNVDCMEMATLDITSKPLCLVWSLHIML